MKRLLSTKHGWLEINSVKSDVNWEEIWVILVLVPLWTWFINIELNKIQIRIMILHVQSV